MKVGQMSTLRLSAKVDYLQLDICGLPAAEALARFQKYKTNIRLYFTATGQRKGRARIISSSESRIILIARLRYETTIQDCTIHPPYRKKVTMEAFAYIRCD